MDSDIKISELAITNKIIFTVKEECSEEELIKLQDTDT